MPAAAPIVRRVLAVLAWGLVGLGAVLLSVWVHLAQEAGRQLLGEAVASWVTEKIPGSMSIERLAHVGPSRVVAEGVVFREPEKGRRVIALKEVELEPVLSALLDGEVRFTRGRIRGGSLWMVKPPVGRMDIARTFAWDRPKTEPGSTLPIQIILAPLHLEGLALTMRVDDRVFRIRGISAFMSIFMGETEEIRFERVSGTFHLPKGPVGEVPFKEFEGEVHPRKERMVELAGMLQLAGSDVKAAFVYFDRDDPPKVRLRLSTKGLTRATLVAMGFAAATKFIPQVAGSVDLSGSWHGLEVEMEDDE
jgi:hypothetical protein